MVRLEGTITAKAPITVSYIDVDGLPRTPHGEFILYGGTLRGPLRKATYHALRALLAKHRKVGESQVFTLADAYMLGEGVDISRALEAEQAQSVDPDAERTLRRLNPMLNLFGRWKLPGRLSIGEMRGPESALMGRTGAGTRADMFERDTDEMEYLSDDQHEQLLKNLESERASHRDIAAIQAQQRALRKQIHQSSGAERKALSEQLRELDNQIKGAKQARAGAVESIKHPIQGFESVSPGTEMSHRITLVNGTETDLGLLLWGLIEFARDPVIGGHRGIGCGEISALWSVSEWPQGSLEPDDIGTVALGSDGVHISSERLTQAMQAFKDRLGEFDFSVHTLDQARTVSVKAS